MSWRQGRVRPEAGSSGEPLSEGVRHYFETQFQTDLDDVRIHRDGEAASEAEQLGASAFATGREIYFARGMYAPGSVEGRALLGHEITHVIQQRNAGDGGSELTSDTDHRSAESEAEHASYAIMSGASIGPVSTAARGVFMDVGWARRGPLPDPYGTLILLNSFAGKFPNAGRLIHRSPAAMKLVDEAEKAGITFGGYSEDGPAPTVGRPYTVGTKVYVPKTSSDDALAMSDFLFELNNALRSPTFAALATEAAKGSKGTLTAKEFARRVIEQEVEGMLRLGQIWFETKKAEGRAGLADPHDADFFLSEFEAVHAGRKTKTDVVTDVLARVYTTGTLTGKTHEQNYMEQYNNISGGK